MDRPRPNPELLRECTLVSRWASLALCVAIWVAVVALAWAGSRDGRWAPLAVLLIAGLQHHLLILVHESAHVLIHPNRRVNDLIGNVFCAIPLLTIVKNYRSFHLIHHRFVGCPKRDPEVRFFQVQGYTYARRGPVGFARLILRDLLFVNLFRAIGAVASFATELKRDHKVQAASAAQQLLFFAMWGTAIAAAVTFDFWRELLIFWVLPQLTIVYLLLKLHAYGEHTGASGPTEQDRTWVHEFNPIVNYFLYPITSGYHLEHHLFPRVPWYHMKRFRRALLADPDYEQRAAKVTVDGYFFGKRTILRTMLLGEGNYRHDLAAQSLVISGEVVSLETRDEVVTQLGS